MTTLEEQIDSDIHRFFENIENQSESDKIKTLRFLLQKYAHLSKAEFLMNHYDFLSIQNSAKTKFSNDTFPIFLGEKRYKVTEGQLSTLSIIEATIGHLSKNQCFNRLPKFDKRKDKF